MSYAINRKQIKESASSAPASRARPFPKKGHPVLPRRRVRLQVHRVQSGRGQQLLDSIGLNKKDAEGFRLFPSGKRVADRALGGRGLRPLPRHRHSWSPRTWRRSASRSIVQIRERALHFQMREANDLQAEIWNQDTAGFPFTGSTKYDFRKDLYGNLTYGPLWKQWYDTNGKEGVEPPAEAKKIVELLDKAKTVGPGRAGQDRPGDLQALGGQHVRDRHRRPDRHGPGRGGGQRKLHNVPANLTKDWPLRTPGNGRPEVWFFK